MYNRNYEDMASGVNNGTAKISDLTINEIMEVNRVLLYKQLEEYFSNKDIEEFIKNDNKFENILNEQRQYIKEDIKNGYEIPIENLKIYPDLLKKLLFELSLHYQPMKYY